jgi:DNA-binding transcriptional LysR family regulator
MESVIGLVAAGVGISVGPSIAKRLRISGVDYINIRESYAVMEFAMAWRADNTSPVVRAFIDLVGKSVSGDRQP